MCDLSPSMTDEEIAELLDDNLSSDRRQELVAKLNKDPIAAEILALAYPEVDTSGGGIPEKLIDELVELVRTARDGGL